LPDASKRYYLAIGLSNSSMFSMGPVARFPDQKDHPMPPHFKPLLIPIRYRASLYPNHGILYQPLFVVSTSTLSVLVRTISLPVPLNLITIILKFIGFPSQAVDEAGMGGGGYKEIIV